MDAGKPSAVPVPLSPPQVLDWLIALAVAILALTVYVLTLTPSLSYLSPDGSELATIPYVLGLAHSPGYPLYTVLGFLFSHLLPFGDVAHRVNLLSATLGALGVGGLYLIVLQLLPGTPGQGRAMERSLAALAALLFAFSVDFWSQALIAEVYAPNIGLLAVTLLLLMAWGRRPSAGRYFLFALSFGLSLGTHLSNLGFAPAFAFFTALILVTGQRGQSLLLNRQLALSFLGVVCAGALGFLLGAAQFAWLPLRANTLNDRFMLRHAPTTIEGLYKYTLGAFSNLKFAFPLPAIPGRIVIYLDLLHNQFGLAGIAVGIIGLFVLLWKRLPYFYLFVGIYLVNVWFFIQYKAFDLEVFFIPAHFVWAIFLAFGAWGILDGIRQMISKGRRVPHREARTGFQLGAWAWAAILALSLIPLLKNWGQNDYSNDTAINDFYANLWERLPEGAALLTPGGVFGYDAFYWQMVYNTRPDVYLPTLPSPNPSPDALRGREIYATASALRGSRGPGALPPGLIAEDLWAVPVLFGEQPQAQTGKRQSLVLYHLSPTPPPLTAAAPQYSIPLEEDMGVITLLGADMAPQSVESGDSVQLTLYWKLHPRQRPPRVEVKLLGQVLAQYEVGFGLLPRYLNEVGIVPGEVLVERYEVVIPATTPPGEWELTIAPVTLRGESLTTTVVASLDVVDQVGVFEYWLSVASAGDR